MIGNQSYLSKIVDKYNSINVAAKATIWFTICNFLLKGISFISVPLFTRLLSSDEYGILSVYMSYEQIILTLTTWETALSAYQRGLFKYKDNDTFFTTSTLLLSNIVTIIFFIFVGILFRPFNSFTKFSVIDTIWLLVYMLMQPAYSCWVILKRTRYDYKSATASSLLYGIISVVVPLIAVLHISQTAEIKFRYTLIASVVFFSFFFYKIC